MAGDRPRVFVTRQVPEGALAPLEGWAHVEVWPEFLPPPREELARRLAEADGVITMITDRIDDDLLAAAPRLRVVSNCAVGYDNVDVAAARRRGVMVTHTPGVLTEATADLAFALILACARRLPQAEADLRAGRWTTWHPLQWLGLELDGATLGIVGLGRIGRAVARRARAFGMRILYYSRRRDPAAEAELGVEYRDLDDLLAEADVVSLHVPLNAETRHLIDGRRLRRMKPGAILVNTARGDVVDEQALVEALRSGHLGAAGLDVYGREPVPPDHPLLQVPNVVALPHIGSATARTRWRMARLAAENCAAVLQGRRPPHPVREML
ncbi:Glyoxylate reductase [Thermaerobacter marianensis DSM 12885]|uniref:Glyoxylate reductase n=1 Tax=Thermaerobacter marianensis (strain ATCC 700841 / DSM 12885 / JCM 10246 / 7p75a) TaxID=644966 RepID=E6SM22_THEM7|nr:D-glycerate dehydrogenase [Thermaerobacter marianensis]ADU50352.1 Glyoxylate reductase [Thermaerobacter marianensis DSM 12885]